MQSTFMAKNVGSDRKCYIIDAKDKILGHVATKAVTVLRGKHKPIFTPHADTGDMVVVINAEHIKVSGTKTKDKEYQTYSGYHSGRRVINFEELMKKNPAKIIEIAVKGMLPKNRMGSKIFNNLKVYVGENHPHIAQQPVALEV